MFSASLENVAVWQPVLHQAILRESLVWIQTYASLAELGDYPLNNSGWYACVHGYETLPEMECCWENHKHTIDIQYIVSGCEGIRWTDVEKLGTPREYLKIHDREEFDAKSDDSSLVIMNSDIFAIFLPGEAHCPKIALRGSERLRKVVVKIPVSLIEGNT